MEMEVFGYTVSLLFILMGVIGIIYINVFYKRKSKNK